MNLADAIEKHMTENPISIQQDAELTEALSLMNQHDIRHLPVLEEGRLVGLVSERDLTLIETLLPANWESISVAEAMSTEPYAVTADTSVGEVARVMAEQKIGSAVVIDGSGAVRGIFTTVDALHALAKACGLTSAP